MIEIYLFPVVLPKYTGSRLNKIYSSDGILFSVILIKCVVGLHTLRQVAKSVLCRGNRLLCLRIEESYTKMYCFRKHILRFLVTVVYTLHNAIVTIP